MGRRPQHDSDRIATAVRIPVDLHERLQREAQARDVSINYLIIRGISLALDRLTPLSATERELQEDAPSI
jgi:predicted HicB family RNase H-like nuclease